MDVEEMLQRVGKLLHVQRAFGEPIERDGVTVIPVALVAGGGGGGGDGRDPEGSGAGAGGVVRPLGVYEIKNGESRFIPAVNATMIAAVAIIAVAVTVRAILVGRHHG